MLPMRMMATRAADQVAGFDTKYPALSEARERYYQFVGGVYLLIFLALCAWGLVAFLLGDL